MLGELQARLTYANVMATLAAFLALGGTLAWALERNSVRSKHIVNGQVQLADAQKTAFGRGVVFGAIDTLGSGAGSGITLRFPSGNSVETSLAAVVPVPLRLRDFRVELTSDLTAGTREFSLGRISGGILPVFEEGLSCEIGTGERSCTAPGPSPKFSPGDGIRLMASYSNAAGGTSASFSWRAATP